MNYNDKATEIFPKTACALPIIYSASPNFLYFNTIKRLLPYCLDALPIFLWNNRSRQIYAQPLAQAASRNDRSGAQIFIIKTNTCPAANRMCRLSSMEALELGKVKSYISDKDKITKYNGNHDEFKTTVRESVGMGYLICFLIHI